MTVAFEQIESDRRGRMPFTVVARRRPGLALRGAQADRDVVGAPIAARSTSAGDTRRRRWWAG